MLRKRSQAHVLSPCSLIVTVARCAQRDATTGALEIDVTKFPDGFKPLTSLAHSLGLKIGIYTSVSAVTCGGFAGSLHHEELDSQTFVEWGFDFIKHDSCGQDYSVHDGGLQNATLRMRDGIAAASTKAGRPVVG